MADTAAEVTRRPPVNLSNKTVQPMAYAGGWDVRWDTDVKGLGVRLYPGGKKSFVLSYRCAGRKRLMDIGEYGTLTVPEARRQAKGFLVDAGKGIDPLDARRKAAQGESFRDLSEKFIEEHSKRRKKTWKEDRRRIDQHVPSQWFGKRADSIKRADVSRLHSNIGKDHLYEANRVLALLKTMFNRGIEWGFLPEGAHNPADRINRFKEQKRERWVTPTELPALARAIDAEANIYVRSALWLYLLTGVRKTELLGAKWEDVNWDDARLRLPETKSGQAQTVPLSKSALAILQAVPKIDGNPYILPGKLTGRPLVNIGKPWRAIRERAGLIDVRLHDLRRTVGSWLSADGVDLNRIKDALRHQDIQTTLVYARLSDDSTREPMEEHGRRMMEIAGRLKVVDG